MARVAGARIVVGMIVFAAIAAGGFFLRDYVSANVTDLRVGDCFDLPSSTVETVKDVQHHPCNETHNAELIALLTYPGDGGAPYPNGDALDNFATSNCVAAFASYTGRNAYTDNELTLGWLIPTPDGWSDGDRGVSCHLQRLDEGPMTHSYRISSTSS